MKKPVYLCVLLVFLQTHIACSTNQTTEEDPTTEFKVVTIVDGLDVPWGMDWLPDGRMLVTERSGKVLVIENDVKTGELSGLPEVYDKNQGGLLDVQVHPDYENNGWIYFSYSKPGDGGASTAIMRAKLEGNALVSQEVIYESFPKTRSGVHFGSRIVFDDKGFIFFSIGERGEKENAQKLENPYGKVHRLHDDGRVPEDNPFVSDPEASHSIWTYGNRNIQGMAFHPASGELYSHEHGPQGGDELNIMKKGENYGWPEVTYGVDYGGGVISDETTKPGIKDPIHYWDPSIAPSGMTFVNSDRYPKWKNNILLGALKFQYLCRVVIENGKYVKEAKLLEGIGRVRDVAQSPDGYIYVAVDGGKIVKLVPED
ncbi:PQQ-dependent sugar dehydrogenase [Marivirga sp. S37H4]|uniref:PQQ-dependent sugar dehydrogenase n=1 Tax=Marivirga aurantiaca TaxID=2802615 RepID=A0A934X2I3_9BACT|nr:PQQ-dependent sugar dehydrogenase [Marivirga aurantiaca]MBK6267155.1 PQQ-dependent sugar dehydrogenase [Marivirga aurantiaca]